MKTSKQADRRLSASQPYVRLDSPPARDAGEDSCGFRAVYRKDGRDRCQHQSRGVRGLGRKRLTMGLCRSGSPHG